jgi:hypothetical protein
VKAERKEGREVSKAAGIERDGYARPVKRAETADREMIRNVEFASEESEAHNWKSTATVKG